MRKRYLILLLSTGVVLDAWAKSPASELPACRGAVASRPGESCRMRLSFFGTDALGNATTGEQRHEGSNEPIDGVLRGNAPYRSRYNYLHTNWSPVVLRAPLPLNASYLHDALSYEVLFWAGLEATPETPRSYEAPMRIRLSLGDDQGRHLVPLREVEVPVTEVVDRPYTVSVRGLNLGFEPVFLYVELEQASPAPDRAAGAMIRVQGFHAALRPTSR